MGLQIFTDSASDITQAQAAEMNITVIPLTVTFGETSYLDGIDLDHTGFYNKLIETDTLPVTSQISPFGYEEYFKKALDAGDEVLCIVLSSKLSGCYQSANIATQELEGNISIVDSENVTVGQHLLVDMAVKLRAEGKNAAQIAEILDVEKKKIRLIALLGTLEYLKKGGRINSAVAIAGNLLSIKPVVTVDDGAITFAGMARGSKNSNNKLIEYVKKEGGIDFDKNFYLAYTGHSKELLDKYIEDSLELYDGKVSDFPTSTVGCAIGTHIGPGAICIAFFCNK